MRPVRLYIQNFMCYEHGFIDFTEFNAALIVGKIENNDLYSNGVGKTTIFKAIEYVLFNQSDINLEKVIRDDEASCRIVMDFFIGSQEYRVGRTRTKKGSTDVILLSRNAQDGSIDEVYHNAAQEPYLDKKQYEKYWKDLSGSRASDTEKSLFKLIKMNHKAFRSTLHFMQNDMTGLPTASPEKRKALLKEALNLIIYSKLEKIAKDRASLLCKGIEKNKILVENMGNPSQELSELMSKLLEVETILSTKNIELGILTDQETIDHDNLKRLADKHSKLEGNFSVLLSKKRSLTSEKSRIETNVKEYSSKKSNVIKTAQQMIDEVASLKIEQDKLMLKDYSQIDLLTEEVSKKKELIAQHNLTIKLALEEYEVLKVPIPDAEFCERCRQPMTAKHRQEEKKRLAAEMIECQNTVKKTKANIVSINGEISKEVQLINELNIYKQQLEGINLKIATKNREIKDKNNLYDEYVALYKKFLDELETKNKEIEIVDVELQSSSMEEADILLKKIEQERDRLNLINQQILTKHKEITHYTNNQAVLQHSIDQKNIVKSKKDTLEKEIFDLETKVFMYPKVLHAFSSTGIPNLIIQNVLDDLQVESNNLLSQLKPGLQLSFLIEKTKGDGDQADTLDINYLLNGKPRYYEQLSGAQQLAVVFSLKLGLSFLLQKMLGVDIQMLLLDEIDQSLDKAGVDAFADIVKFFQKDYKILVITHNDRLKDKFSHAILVEQDLNMVSRAKVVSSW